MPKEEELNHEKLGYIVRLQGQGRRIKESGEALYTKYTGYKYEDEALHYIPYYAWCNRGIGEMTVYGNCYTE